MGWIQVTEKDQPADLLRKPQTRLSTTISGLVFWGIVLFGVLNIGLVVLFTEADNDKIRELDAHRLLQSLESELLSPRLSNSLDARRTNLEAAFAALQPEIAISGTTLFNGSETLEFGVKQADAITVKLNSNIRLNRQDSDERVISAIFYFPASGIAERAFRENLLIAVGGISLLFGLILNIILRGILTRPFDAMISSAQEYAAGNKSTRFEESRNDDFGFLSKFINLALQSSEDRQTELETAVQELADKNHQLEASQQALIQSEKLAALGGLVAGVAHELNTPLGAIRASISNISRSLPEVVEKLPSLAATVSDTEFKAFEALIHSALETSQSGTTTREERQRRRKFVEHMKSLDISNASKVADLLVDSGLLEIEDKHLPALESDRQAELLDQVHRITGLSRNSANVQLAADRSAKIVFALKNYAHPGVEDEFTQHPVAESIETILTLYQNQIKRGVTVHCNFDSDTTILGMHDLLNQVWTNLLHNALHAMDYDGRLDIDVRRVENGLSVEFSDNGKGISEELQQRIFEPFYTTKAIGEGTGLGLSICQDIISNHHGSINVESQPGRTCFSVFLPDNLESNGDMQND